MRFYTRINLMRTFWPGGALVVAIVVLSLLMAGASSRIAHAETCGTDSATFTYTGTEQCYTVPTGVTTVTVTAHGATGGSTATAGGGTGAVANDVLSVTPGETLWVEVGEAGASGSDGGSATFGGGGAAGSAGIENAASGGGASDVRTTSCGPDCTGTASLNSRLIVAGGGGGAGGDSTGGIGTIATGGAGGNAGTGSGGAFAGADGTGGDGGGAGTGSAGGGGGAGAGMGQDGADGALGVGGAGGPSTVDNTDADGGGGGGGYYGGGGGGASVTDASQSAGGGGGGSSYGPAGTTFSTASGAASVTIALGAGPVVATDAATSITSSSAELNGAIDDQGTATDYHFEWGTTTSYGNSTPTQTSAGSTSGAQDVSAEISGLSAGTTYYVRLVAGTTSGGDVTFTTPAPPIVTTGSATATASSAQLGGTIDPSGQATTYYFQYGTSTAYGSSTANQTLSSTTGVQAVSVPISGLTANTTYHFQLVASSAGGTTDGADVTFTTPLPPPVSTGAATNVGDTTAVAAGTVDPQGLATTYYFQYGTTTAYGNVTTTQAFPTGVSGPQPVSATLTGLARSTGYHVQLVAQNANGTSAGSDVSFTTTSGMPIVTTGAVTDLTSPATGSGSAQFNGTIDPAGYTTTYHFDYHPVGSSATTSTPSVTLPTATGVQTVSARVANLVPALGYGVVLVATNANGTSSGSEQTFTAAGRAPLVQTCCGVAATTTSVTLRGFVLTPGAGSYHFDYGLTTAYGHSTDEQPYSGTTSPIVLEQKIDGLSPHTEYHFRLVATNGSGTTDGADEILGTATGSTAPPPEVVSAASQVSQTTVTLHGVVNTSGEPGVAYFQYGPGSLTTETDEVELDPSSDNQPVEATIDVSSLEAAQTYVFQLVVTTTGGSSGLAGTFDMPTLPPVVANAFVTGVTESTANVQCQIDPQGAQTDVTIAYTATGPAPRAAASASDYDVQHVTAAVALDAGQRDTVFPTFDLAALDAGTIYSFTCHAQDSAGTTIATPAGAFTTATPSIPTVTTDGFHVTAGETSAELDALVDPGGKNTEYFFQYGLTAAYGSQVDSTDQVAATSGPTAVDLVAANLSPNTTYHYRAGAKYADGTVVYGADETFVTGKPDGAIDVQSAQAVGATLQVEIDNAGLEKGAQFRVDAVTQAQFAQNQFDQAYQAQTTSAFAPVPSDQLASQYTINLRNLQPGTTYYAVVRFEQTVGSGTQNWLDTGTVSFTTGGFIATEPATLVTTTSATLNGIASGPGPYQFVYYPIGQPSSSTTVATVESFPDADELTHEDYTAPVTGLTPGTRYVVNLVGSDRKGTPIDVDTLGGACPAGSAQVSQQTITNTQFVVSGCWTGATAGGDLPSTGPYVGVGALMINGIEYTPASSDGTVSIDTDTDVLSTSGGENIAAGTTSLYSADEAPLSVVFNGSDSHFFLAADQVSADAAVFGLPVTGATVISPQEDGTTQVATIIGMPAIFGSGAGMQTTLQVNPDGTVVAPTVNMSTPANIGPIVLPNLSLTYKNGTTWVGQAVLQLPGAGLFTPSKGSAAASGGVTATIQFTGDELTGLGVDVSGVSIPLGASGAVINSIGAELGDNPFNLQGSIGMSVGPDIGKFSALSIAASVYVAINSQEQLPSGLPGVVAGETIQSPFTLKVDGSASLLGLIPIAQADIYYYGLAQPFVAFDADLNASFTVGTCPGQSNPAFGVTAGGTLAGAFQGSNFNLEGDLGVQLQFACVTVLSASADSAISSDGIAFCGTLATPFGALSIGAGELWGSPGTSISTNSIGQNLTFYGASADNGACSVSNYEYQFTLVNARREASANFTMPVLTFPAGKRFAVVKFVGKGGPPLVSISGPDGRSVTAQAGKPTVDTKEGFLVLPDARTDVTTVSIANPGTGEYHVKLLSGSPAVESVKTATSLPMPNLHARVTGRGATRTLAWHAATIAGQTLEFEETGGGGEHTILRTAKASGSISFRPSDGRAGKRNLVAIVFEHGAQRQIVHAATFQAPQPPRPQARDLRVRRHGSSVQVTWAGNAVAYDVQLTTTAGLNLRQRTTTTSAAFTQVATGFSGVVSVRPISAAMVVGQAKRATLRGGPQLTLSSGRLTVTQKGVVSAPVRCSGGRCQAVLELVMNGAHGLARVALATARLPAGHASVVTLRLTKQGERLFKTRKATTATLTVSTGDSTTVTRRVRLLGD